MYDSRGAVSGARSTSSRATAWKAIGLTLVAGIVFACAPTTELLYPVGNREPATIAVVDETGWFRQVMLPIGRVAIDWQGTTFVANPPHRPTVLRLFWISGRCLTGATIRIAAAKDDDLTVSVTSRSNRASPGCREDIGKSYMVDLVFDREIAAGDVRVQDLTDVPLASPSP